MRIFVVATVLIFITSCGDRVTTDVAPNSIVETAIASNFTDWLNAEYEQELDFSPLAKTRLGYKSDLGELDDESEQAQERELQWRRDSVARMHADFDRETLTEQGQLAWDLWEHGLEVEELNAPFRRHAYIFGRNGPQTDLPSALIDYHAVETEADLQAYISRLNQSGRYLRQYLERTQLAAADGIFAPHFDFDRAMSEIERVLSGAPFTDDGSSAIWSDINAKVAGLVERGIINSELARGYTEQARIALLDHFKPANEEIHAWLSLNRQSLSDQARGAWALPNGEAYYQARLQTNTTLDLSAAEIHQIGLQEILRIHAEMEEIKRQVGFSGSLLDFFEFMRNDRQFLFPNNDSGREEYLALAEDLLQETYQKLPEFFGLLPKAGLQVKRVESYREQAGGSAHYRRGTPDGSRPGTFYVHLIDMNAVPKNLLEALAYHEGVPGHHMQRSIQQELEDVPDFQRSLGYTAYTEGWGLYAEQLGKEMGGYADPYADFGRLSGEIWRAVRLVVDTGIHALRWSEAEAVAFALSNSPRPEASVHAEIQRYFNNPGQATAYMIGMLKIRELRDRAETALGTGFDVRGFHDLVLESGPIPLDFLERRVESWIESNRL